MPHLDKLEHALVFAVLAWGGVRVWGSGRLVIISLLIYGLLIELLQGFTTYRSADPLDVLADVTGLCLGLWLARWRL